jgi:hypothetical protein
MPDYGRDGAPSPPRGLLSSPSPHKSSSPAGGGTRLAAEPEELAEEGRLQARADAFVNSGRPPAFSQQCSVM